MNLVRSVEELVGKTPLVELNRLKEKLGLQANLIAKIEAFNPTSSVKDRAAKQIIEDAEKENLINKDSVLIEPTSGNFGISIAMIAAIKGYRAILVMPDSMSIERRKIMKAFGAELVLSEGKKGMPGAIERAAELAKTIPNSFIPSQFDNPSNPKAHYLNTGREIWESLDGNIDIFVAGIGTGGTISGTGKYLKEQKDAISIVAVEPEGSPVLSKGEKGPHKIQGIGAGFIPNNLNTEIYDRIEVIKDDEAFAASRELAKTEGLLVGISSGAALKSAINLALLEENKDKNIVVLLPDTGERYLSTTLFEE